jgi:hypothetical protein
LIALGLLKGTGLTGIGSFVLGGLGSFPLDATGGEGGLMTEIAVPTIVVVPNPQIISRTR